jgi:hypothetical protein
MGLFDNIIVNRKFKLPLPENLDEELTEDFIYEQEIQTKDLDNSLSTYDLNEDGSLTERVRNWVGDSLVETRERDIVSTPKIIVFYIYIREDELKNDYLLEWEYTYTESEKSIKLLKYKITDNMARKKLHNDFFENLDRRNTFLSKWYMQPYNWYAWIIRKLFRYYNIIGNKLPSQYKVENWLTPL